MEYQRGRYPVFTDDRKTVEGHHLLNVKGVNVSWGGANGFTDTMTFFNCSGMDLLVLTADGMRFVSRAGGRNTGKCYFLKTYRIGSITDLDLSPQLEMDLITREDLDKIEKYVDNARRCPTTGRVLRTEVTIEFRYEIDCTNIEFMSEGIWIPFLGLHVYKSCVNDFSKLHYGRASYTEVLLAIENNRRQDYDEIQQAAGTSAIYITNDKRNVAPVIVANKYYQGVLHPTFSEARPPGIYIAQINERKDLDNQHIQNFVTIPLMEFQENNVFRSRDELLSHMRGMGKKAQNKEELEDLAARLFTLGEGFNHKSKQGGEEPKGRFSFMDLKLYKDITPASLLELLNVAVETKNKTSTLFK